MKPTPADTLNGVPVMINAEDAAETRDRNLRHDDEGVDERLGGAVKDAGDEQQCERHDDHQAAIGGLKLAVLARPFEMHAFGQIDFFRDSALGLVDGALQIAAADGKPDRHVTLQILTIDE